MSIPAPGPIERKNSAYSEKSWIEGPTWYETVDDVVLPNLHIPDNPTFANGLKAHFDEKIPRLLSEGKLEEMNWTILNYFDTPFEVRRDIRQLDRMNFDTADAWGTRTQFNLWETFEHIKGYELYDPFQPTRLHHLNPKFECLTLPPPPSSPSPYPVPTLPLSSSERPLCARMGPHSPEQRN